MSGYNQRKLYRSRHGIVFGVCQGIADWKELPVGMVRLVTVAIFLFTGVFPLLFIYLGLALFLPVEPRDDDFQDHRSSDDDGPRSYHKRKADKEQDWDQRFYDRK